MDNQFTTIFLSEFTTEETDTGSGFAGSGYTGDYGILDAGMCQKSWVRGFRMRYEPPLFWLIFILGAVGNLLVVLIYTVVRHRLKTMTDVYLLNLAVADLLFLCTLPFWASDAARGWEFGVCLCKMVSAVYKINFFSSMLLLTCISVDRYVAIVQVTKAQNTKKKRLLYSKLACLAVWLLSVLLALPEMVYAKVRESPQGQLSCEPERSKVLVGSLQICMGFLLPLLVMAVCYSVIIRTLLQARSFEKHKALRVIFAVVAAFVLSQLPHNVHLMVRASQAANPTITDCALAMRFDVAEQIAKSLAYTHACLNPFLYVFVGVRFRKDLLRILRMCTGAPGAGGICKSLPKRPSVMSDTETTPALSL